MIFFYVRLYVYRPKFACSKCSNAFFPANGKIWIMKYFDVNINCTFLYSSYVELSCVFSYAMSGYMKGCVNETLTLDRKAY